MNQETKSTVRATCWSITINNPKDEDLKPVFPNNKWVMTGQIECGEEGTEHYQGMLKTPQVRFSEVKKVLPRAHIEVAKNKVALEKYVSKEDTRVATVPEIRNNIPTLFDYQHSVALKWDDIEFAQLCDKHDKLNDDDVALMYVDILVAKDIRNGMNGVEYIAVNPMWRNAWKRFWRAMVARERDAKIKSTEEYKDETTTECEEQSDCGNQENV